MERYIEQSVINDLKKKMVFVGGPRQVGKTTMAKNLATESHRYINWDIYEDQQFIIHQNIPDSQFVIFDEIHKYPKWRNYLKGIFDKYNNAKTILVTGSAKLDYYRYSGDSLQGRYYYYRLHPLSVKELGVNNQAEMIDLMTLGGFPEPYFSGSKVEAKRWARDYQKRFIYEEVSSLEQTKNLSQMQLLMERLPDLVGSPLSVNALREDLQVAHKTVDKWLDIFERMHSFFRLSAFGAPNIKAVKKERKHYLFNWSLIADEEPCFENLIACHLLKWCHYQQDAYGEDIELKYFRDKTGKEVDFIICQNKKPIEAIEVKLTNRDVSKNLIYFKRKFPDVKASQVALNNKNYFITKDDIHMVSWKELLTKLI